MKTEKAHRFAVTYMVGDIVNTLMVCDPTSDDLTSAEEWFKEEYEYVTHITPEVLRCEYLGYGCIA